MAPTLAAGDGAVCVDLRKTAWGLNRPCLVAVDLSSQSDLATAQTAKPPAIDIETAVFAVLES